MINFSAISQDSIIGKILRKTLWIIPNSMQVPIIQGTLKGKKWIKGSGVNGYWMGTYELEKQQVLRQTIKKGDIFFDIGANVGFYSLIAAELTGVSGMVFAFEPLPENFYYLKKHIALNAYKNIFPFEVAIADNAGLSAFGRTGSRSEGCITENGELKVETIKLDDWFNDGRLPLPDILKIDVEGAEDMVLKGAVNILRQRHPLIFLSMHGEKKHYECCRLLLSLGYKLEPLGESDIDKAMEVIAKI